MRCKALNYMISVLLFILGIVLAIIGGTNPKCELKNGEEKCQKNPLFYVGIFTLVGIFLWFLLSCFYNNKNNHNKMRNITNM